jgi:TM2 domain-containing membrane protein YozV
MTTVQTTAIPQTDWIIHCPWCGQAMLLAAEHAKLRVACPHCNETFPACQPPLRYGRSSRSKIIAGILGIVFGCWGVHRFYLGYTGIGILQLVLFFVTFGVSSVWGLIEGILCLVGGMRDADGLELR